MRGAFFIAAVALLSAGCKSSLPDLPPSMIPEPAAADVETVLFLVGDAGDATEARFPVVHALRADVEGWASRLRRDSAVIVLYLGDVIYPDGMSVPGERDYLRDSTVVAAQINVLAGPNARRYAQGIFMAGNHDWGNAKNIEGIQQLQELEAFLARQRERGFPVRLLPVAGTPGPAVLDVGRRLSLFMLDTAWWLLAGESADKLRMVEETEAAMQRARAAGRHVVFAAHHPWASAGPHGGNISFWKTFGVRYLLARSGAILQDINSLPYRELSNALDDIFSAGPPLVWAAGHDHNLQVISHPGSNSPLWTIVSGSGSKVSSVGHIEGMRYRSATPGYGKLFVRRDGHVDLIMVTSPDEEALSCEVTTAELPACMARHVASFAPRFGIRLR